MTCRRCALVWLDPAQRPSLDEELTEYRLHNNDPNDPRYRRHLAKLTDPLTQGMFDGAEGLDFGSGPGPAIKPMLEERGFRVTNYDPNFAPDAAAIFERKFDFISCTETAEHFHDPAMEFETFSALIEPGGRIGLMTRLRTDDIDFPNWFYIRENSHVTFYAPDTMQWIAARFRWRVEITLPDVTIFYV